MPGRNCVSLRMSVVGENEEKDRDREAATMA